MLVVARRAAALYNPGLAPRSVDLWTLNTKPLQELGWSDWFEQRAGGQPPGTIARVAAVDREQLLLVDQTGPFRARLAGSYLHRHHLSVELPCVGDWVCLDQQPGDGFGVIHALLERRTSLRRKSAGTAVEYQMIAANVDYVVLVQSCHFDFNLNRMERYLVMVREGGAEPYLLLTKTDLVTPEVLAAQVEEIRSAGITAPLVTLSNVTREGVDDLQRCLLPGRTYCFVGSSGVGKSTLINHLLGRERLETQAVSATGEGRHTTVRRELIRLAGGALVIDNPGMREFGLLGAADALESSYSDLTALAAGCRYRDCTHLDEPGCAVLAAVASGDLSREHFENYQKLREESEFYQLSYAEKRKKDRDFGQVPQDREKGPKTGIAPSLSPEGPHGWLPASSAGRRAPSGPRLPPTCWTARRSGEGPHGWLPASSAGRRAPSGPRLPLTCRTARRSGEGPHGWLALRLRETRDRPPVSAHPAPGCR